MNDSFLLALIEDILVDKKGIISEIDDTSNTPENQFKKYKSYIVT